MCAETLGSWGSHGLNLIKMIGNKLKDATGEPRSTFFLFQQISMAIQKCLNFIRTIGRHLDNLM